MGALTSRLRESTAVVTGAADQQVRKAPADDRRREAIFWKLDAVGAGGERKIYPAIDHQRAAGFVGELAKIRQPFEAPVI